MPISMNNSNSPNIDDTTEQPNTRVTTAAITALLLGLLAIVLMLMLAYFVFAQRIPELTPQRLEEAQALWAKSGPATYTMDIQLGGARPGPVHVEVVDGEVVAMTRDGKTPDQERVWAAWSVPGMFDTIEQELDLAEDPVGRLTADQNAKVFLRCKFDSQLGYPSVFHRAVRGGGPEVYWEVTKFEAQP
jgi:hypothetical protein